MIAAPSKHGQRRNIGGSQFFINLVDNNFLDGKHPVFGICTADNLHSSELYFLTISYIYYYCKIVALIALIDTTTYIETFTYPRVHPTVIR